MTALGTPTPGGLGRRRLHDDLTEHLGKAIVDGLVGPGQPLPNEKDLADAYHVSRTVARQALLLLDHKGLVKSRHGLNTVVSPRAHWNLLDRDVLHWILASDTQPGTHAAPLDGGALRTAVDELVSALNANAAQLRANPLYDALMRFLSAAGSGTASCDAPDLTTTREDATP